MAEIIKRNRKEWLIYHYNIWLKTLTSKEINLEVIKAEGAQGKNIVAYTKAVSHLRGMINEAKTYLKVIEELLKKEKK